MPRRLPCDLTALTDYARGLGSEFERGQLEGHLAECVSCRTDLAALTRLAEVARLDRTEVPGRAAMQRALAIAADSTPDPVVFLPHWLGRLIDGGGQPALAGLRSATAEDQRQGVFHAGPYEVRVRVDPDARSSTCVVLGQLQARETGREVGSLPVLVTVGSRVLGRTESNVHGEFELTSEANDRLRLQVVVDGGRRRVELPLARFLRPSPEDQ